jgi:hypothetical protein
VSKFDSLSVKVVNSFSVEMQEFIIGRLSRMDDKTLIKNLNNQDEFIKSFE